MLQRRLQCDSMIATRKLRRARVLIVGCGDVGLRAVPPSSPRAAAPRVIALSSHPERAAELRAAGTTPSSAIWTTVRASDGWPGLSSTVLHLAPPQKEGDDDRRTQRIDRGTFRAPSAASRAASTSPMSPVIEPGAHGFARASEPHRRTRKRPSKLRILYPTYPMRLSRRPAAGRPSGSSMRARRAFTAIAAARSSTRHVRSVPKCAREAARLGGNAIAPCATCAACWRVDCADSRDLRRQPPAAGTARRERPALVAAEDVYTNHIHADDLAAILVLAIRRAQPQRAIHASDDSDLRMGDYFDLRCGCVGFAARAARSRGKKRRRNSSR